MQALKAVEKYKGVLKADSLQQLHAIHNLQLLTNAPGGLPKGVAPTLRDGELSAQADAIKEANSNPETWLLHAYYECRTLTFM